MTDTAVLSIWDAIAATIAQGPAVPVGPDGTVLLNSNRFYRGSAPATAALGYFILGSVSETESGFIGQRGQRGTYRIHCWSTSSANALRLYQWLKGLLHERILLLEHNTLVRGDLSLVTTQSDSDGKAWQAIADYNAESLEAA